MLGGAKANVVQLGEVKGMLAPLLILQKQYPNGFAEIVPVVRVCLSNFIIILSSFRVAGNNSLNPTGWVYINFGFRFLSL